MNTKTKIPPLRDTRLKTLEREAYQHISADVRNLARHVHTDRLISAIGLAASENPLDDAMLGHLVRRFLHTEIKLAARERAKILLRKKS